ncbi:phage minor head protein [Rhodoferax sp.]|uniref:phage head morphogenesis protein n=1 Tax=Rhodoferax sp. TaxID=50421 RepID=UPI002852A2A4|nr:phage minor head protein [Rhodoferax sp.]
MHGKVFAIAGATNTDLVDDIQKSLVDALKNGTTITQFRKDWDATVQKYGWSYRGSRGWRTSVIFNTNMRSAHMAGRWKQLVANQAQRPYLQYRTAGDSHVRPQHRMWNGLIYLLSDPFWQTHYPPNGWGCRCTVRAYGEAEMKDKDLSESAPFEIKTREVISADGEIKDRVPIGIDPGWDHNVGQSWIGPEQALGQKLAALPRQLQGPLVDKTISPAFQKVLSDNFKGFKSGIKQPVGQAQIVGFMDSGMINALADKLPEIDLQSTAVSVFDNKTNHLAGNHKASSLQAWPDEWVNSLPEHFRNYRAVLWDKLKKTLIVVPQGSFNKTLPKITMRLNEPTKFGTSASVISLGSASAANLADPNAYDLLLGTLDP